jgi:glycosyltransferase involved in cell wall biosynthesis
MERYLADVNRGLLQRNRMRIIQTHLIHDGSDLSIVDEAVGRGVLTWAASTLLDPTAARSMMHAWMVRVWRHLRRTPCVRHDLLLRTLPSLHVSLAAFHWLSDDARVVRRAVVDASIPYVIVNHFDNARLCAPRIGEWVTGAQLVSGVSSIGVPGVLAGRFESLSDGVDTDFFLPSAAHPVGSGVPGPVILLPSRVTQGKGHLDMVRALGRLSREGVIATLVLAGRIESGAVVRRVRQAAEDEGVGPRVIIVGELSPGDLRDWYGASDLVVLPTYSEGLGRVLLEAQAMETPVIAYRVGGVAEAVAHGRTGWLVPVGDVGALAGRIRELLADPERRRTMGLLGRAHVLARFSLDALTLRHELIYARVLAQAGSAASTTT